MNYLAFLFRFFLFFMKLFKSLAFVSTHFQGSVSNLKEIFNRVNHPTFYSMVRTGSLKLFLKEKKIPVPVKYNIWMQELKTEWPCPIMYSIVSDKKLTIHDLKREIAKERNEMSFSPDVEITDIYTTENCLEWSSLRQKMVASRCRPGDIVPIPIFPLIGSDDDVPYYYFARPLVVKAFNKSVSECKNTLYSPDDHYYDYDYVDLDLDRVTMEICSVVYDELQRPSKSFKPARPLALMRLARKGRERVTRQERERESHNF